MDALTLLARAAAESTPTKQNRRTHTAPISMQARGGSSSSSSSSCSSYSAASGMPHSAQDIDTRIDKHVDILSPTLAPLLPSLRAEKRKVTPETQQRPKRCASAFLFFSKHRRDTFRKQLLENKLAPEKQQRKQQQEPPPQEEEEELKQKLKRKSPPNDAVLVSGTIPGLDSATFSSKADEATAAASRRPTFGAISKMLSAEWKAMTVADKRPFEALAAADRMRYAWELNEFMRLHNCSVEEVLDI